MLEGVGNIIMRNIYILILCFLQVGFVVAEKVSVIEHVTTMTSDAPELNIVLRNLSDKPIEFLVNFGFLSHRKTKCDMSLREYDRHLIFRKSQTGGYQKHHSYGLIPPKRWTHRSYRIGFFGNIPPCSVPYEIVYKQGDNELVIENTVQIPKDYRFSHGYGENSIEAMLESDTVVEELKGRSRKLLIARTILHNMSERGAYVFVSDRGIDCKAHGKASFNLIDGVKQGEDVGPTAIPPKGWVVFKQSIGFQDDHSLESCSAWIQISTFDRTLNIYPLHKAEFSLKHNGMYFDDRSRHHKSLN